MCVRRYRDRMTAARAEHWESVHRDTAPTEAGWWEDEPSLSLDLIAATAATPDTPLIDVGAGASMLVDNLLERDWSDVTVLDLAPSAFATTRARLGARADDVTWVVGDVLEVDLGRTFGIWHDRAVFHFLVDDGDRARYVEQVRRFVRADGFLTVATFGPEAPEQCSGLPVRRHDLDALANSFAGFELVTSRTYDHVGPTGYVLPYVAVVLQRTG